MWLEGLRGTPVYIRSQQSFGEMRETPVRETSAIDAGNARQPLLVSVLRINQWLTLECGEAQF